MDSVISNKCIVFMLHPISPSPNAVALEKDSIFRATVSLIQVPWDI